MNKFYPDILKNFGFGCMRLPMKDDEVDMEQFTEMVDVFIENGFNYFDTAAIYLDGKSETALHGALTSRYSRDSFILTDKLTGTLFEKEEDIIPLFERQLKACGVDYFDFYLMHAQNKKWFEKFKACNAYETAFKLKEEGKIRHVGISFHDSAEVLNQILNEYPQIEVVQIQFNYLDYHDAKVQSKACYDVCVKHKKPVIIMEPVKGGMLAKLPREAEYLINEAENGSAASYALRFAAGQKQVMMVLSGMSTIEQMNENINTMKEFKNLNKNENKMIEDIRDIFEQKKAIKCTSCSYCTSGCPQQIRIPGIFSCINRKSLYEDFDDFKRYKEITADSAPASACIDCGQCEEMCPQKLPIHQYLKEAAAKYEKPEEQEADE